MQKLEHPSGDTPAALKIEGLDLGGGCLRMYGPDDAFEVYELVQVDGYLVAQGLQPSALSPGQYRGQVLDQFGEIRRMFLLVISKDLGEL